MAISEATSYGVPVVVSNNCGIACQITKKSGRVLTLDDGVEDWVKACSIELKKNGLAQKVGKSWQELAHDHIDIYNSI